MKLIYKIYAETFVRRLLRLVEIFTSIALTSAHPLSMVSKVANPYMMYTLFNLMLVSAPRSKLIALRIIKNLISIGIPAQVFETTLNMLDQNKNSIGYRMINGVDTVVKFESSRFLTFFFNYMLSIRQGMWNNQEVQSHGSYEISQEVARLF